MKPPLLRMAGDGGGGWGIKGVYNALHTLKNENVVLAWSTRGVRRVAGDADCGVRWADLRRVDSAQLSKIAKMQSLVSSFSSMQLTAV